MVAGEADLERRRQEARPESLGVPRPPSCRGRNLCVVNITVALVPLFSSGVSVSAWQC